MQKDSRDELVVANDILQRNLFDQKKLVNNDTGEISSKVNIDRATE